ncbi:MAG: hypothetical protein ACQES0_10335, partial [Bacteroidota bacterium]
ATWQVNMIRRYSLAIANYFVPVGTERFPLSISLTAVALLILRALSGGGGAVRMTHKVGQM